MKVSNIIKICLSLLIAISLSFQAFSAVGLNVVLSSQDPDPVSPGNFVYINVKISNTGDSSLKDATIEMVENSVFTIAKGEEKVRALGMIPAYSGVENGKGFVIAKFKVYVSKDAPQGLNTVKFRVNTALNGGFEYEYDILVQDENPKIQVNEFNVETIEAGENSKLNIELENINTIALKDVIVKLNLDEVSDEVLSVLSGSNQKVISLMQPGEKATVSFDLVASPDAESKPYILPFDVEFEDSLDNSFTKEVLGSVSIYSAPIISIRLDSQENFQVGKSKVTLAIANPGTSTIKGTQLEILSSDKYEVLDGAYEYVGDLNPDDFQTVQNEIYIKEKTDLQVKLTYLDSYNNENEKVISIPLKIYSDEELKQYTSTSSSSGGSYLSTIIFLVLIVVAYFVGRRFGYNKGKNKRH